MSTVVKRARVGRRRMVGVLAGLAIGGAAALAPVTYAQAAPNDAAGAPNVGRAASGALRQDQLPPRAVRATHERPTLGAHGAAFQKPLTRDAVSPRIVGGAPANASDHPWIVGIQSYFLNGSEWWVSTCTGTVISPTKVLTAGHCHVGLPAATTYVIAGRNDINLNSGGFVAGVASTWTHQNYNANAVWNQNAVPVDDVAVLTLKQQLPAAYTPVRLSAQGDLSPYLDGTRALIVGYGVTSSASSDTGILYKATVPMKSDATCSAQFGADYDSSRMVCAGSPGVDTCSGDSGGPILVNGVQVGITDWGPTECGSSYGVYERLSYYSDAIKVDLTRPSLVNLDWTGDGHSDLIARNSSGRLIQYWGSGLASDGYGGFAGSGYLAGPGWGGFTKLFRVTDWNGDGTESIMARDSSGRLYQYRSDGEGFIVGGAVQVGTGWNGFTDIMVVNNWTGDGHANLLGRTSTGELYLYTSDGNGGWLNGGIGIKIGTGWNGFNTVLTPGTWDGDGHQALIGRTPAGNLLLYKSDGHGGWLNNGIGVKIGTGWNGFTVFMSPGDWNGDNQVDLVGITPGGAMLLYKTDGYGHWLNGGNGQQIGSGWNVFNAVF